MHLITMGLEELKQAHLYIFNNNNDVVPYIVRHEVLVNDTKKHVIVSEQQQGKQFNTN